MREWLKELPQEDRRIPGVDIKDLGIEWPLGLPLVRSLGRELWEVQVSPTNGRIACVFFCVAGGETVLLQAFIKKTPQHEIDPALKHLKGDEQ